MQPSNGAQAEATTAKQHPATDAMEWLPVEEDNNGVKLLETVAHSEGNIGLMTSKENLLSAKSHDCTTRTSKQQSTMMMKTSNKEMFLNGF